MGQGTSDREEWAGGADVIVIGAGPAGAAAAIAAADRGARPLVLEASTAPGGNCLYAAGFLFDSPSDALVEHLESLCFGRTERGVLEAYAAGLRSLDRWLSGLGATTAVFDPPPGRLPASFPSWPSLPAGDTIGYRVIAGGEGRRGEALWQVLESALRERAIELRTGVRARELLRDDTGAVTGVIAEQDGRRLALRAERGVVLASGGFEADPALTDSFLPLGPCVAVGNSENRGDGLRMALTAGAALWHMYGFFGWFAFRAPQFAAAFAIDFFAPSFLFVDADGHRFGDETGFEVHDRLRALTNYLPERPNRPRLPAYAIFDEAARLAGPLNGMLGSPNDYAWSPDNSAEVECGWIARGESAAELAAAAGLPAATLERTLARYQDAVRVGRDEDFGRAADTLVALEPPLYAIETWPGVAGTTGGPRHDACARVLREDGGPVAGLYAAGSVSSVWGYLIEHGGGLTDALVFGRIAGEQAAGGGAR
ncbi:MAG TPA: FAD-dependent oxidoreductase [Solirubrobacteraceae bacterium]|jgi:succinate dehydrogenase/fumarate reductase flavoprotein subunit|nr:FAD-dependent oxidoreductase [Solirubrobacteraceae bacterium]